MTGAAQFRLPVTRSCPQRAVFALPRASPHEFSLPAGRCLGDPRQLVASECEWPFLLSSFPVREESVFDLEQDSFLRLVHRVSAPVRVRSLYGSFIFFGGALHTVVGPKFGTVGA